MTEMAVTRLLKVDRCHNARLNLAVVWNSLLWLVRQLGGELAVGQWVVSPSADSSMECSVEISVVTGD